jgi:hypothetical protein|tara:strand:+ start:593 stop:754 length:162 start_codon:yes stop_codon:yes gene_type:complete
MMGQSPSIFWESSPIEVYMAIDGFTEFNNPEHSKKEKPMTSDRMKELMELYPD